MDIEEPKTVQNLGAPPPGSTESPMSPQRTRGLPSAAAQQMANILKNNKGSVTINDILNLCFKPPQPKVIRVPGVTNPEDELHFRGFSSANQLLEYLGVDTQKVGDFEMFSRNEYICMQILQWFYFHTVFLGSKRVIIYR